jgi:hypothetical protein
LTKHILVNVICFRKSKNLGSRRRVGTFLGLDVLRPQLGMSSLEIEAEIRGCEALLMMVEVGRSRGRDLAVRSKGMRDKMEVS